MFVRQPRASTAAALAAVTALALTFTVASGPPAALAAGSAHVFPIPSGAGMSATHHDYPATDMMASCGKRVVAPVSGVIDEVNRVDRWTRTVDDPATRGGRYVSIVGDDGVRYYLAHFQSVSSSLVRGHRIGAGQTLGRVGHSGRAGACHVHFALSPPCHRAGEWWVRRGVVPPLRYLRAWRKGQDAQPAAEVQKWVKAHPNACKSPAQIGAA